MRDTKIFPIKVDEVSPLFMDYVASSDERGTVFDNFVNVETVDLGSGISTSNPGPVASDGTRFYVQSDGSIVNIEGINYDEYNAQLNNDLSSNYVIDENGCISLVNVHPELKEKMQELINACEAEGINIRITQDLRTVAEQDALYSQGRDGNEGNIVTNARGSDYASNHQWGVAFDICINDGGDPYDIEKLKRVGEIGRSIGLEWGGDWTSFTDYPHFQLEGCDNIRNIYINPAYFVNDNWGESMFSSDEN